MRRLVLHVSVRLSVCLSVSLSAAAAVIDSAQVQTCDHTFAVALIPSAAGWLCECVQGSNCALRRLTAELLLLIAAHVRCHSSAARAPGVGGICRR